MNAYERIVELAKARGLNVHQLEKQSGLYNGAIGALKGKDDATPSFKICSLLAMFFDVPFEYIATGDIPEDTKSIDLNFTDDFEKMLVEHYRQLSSTHKIEVLHLCEKLFNEERQE